MNKNIFLKQPLRGKSSVEQLSSPKVQTVARRIIALAILCLCTMLSQAQTNIFVSTSGSNDNDGLTWETAKQTITAGLAAIVDSTGAGSGNVFVKAGSYVESGLTIPAGVKVMGGFKTVSAGTDTSMRRLPGMNSHWTDNTWCTIISGASYGLGTKRIATVMGEIDGCVVRNGFTTTYGGGLLLDGGTARFCVIKECDAIDDEFRNAKGGGVYVRNNAQLLNCVVTDNRGDDGAAVAGHDATLINNTITNNHPTDCGTVQDYDGNVYKTVVLGEQCWMRENLRTTHYADGTFIALGSSSSYTIPYRYEGYTSPMSAAIFERCGYLYNWAAVMHGAASSDANPSGVQGICPDGWHVPSKSEWNQMADYVNSVLRFRCNGEDGSIARSLTENGCWAGISSYNHYCGPGNNYGKGNATRFSAWPVGYYRSDAYSNYSEGCVNYSYKAVFYTTSIDENNTAYAYRREMDRDWSSVGSGSAGTYGVGARKDGFSVRCVKDN